QARDQVVVDALAGLVLAHLHVAHRRTRCGCFAFALHPRILYVVDFPRSLGNRLPGCPRGSQAGKRRSPANPRAMVNEIHALDARIPRELQAPESRPPSGTSSTCLQPPDEENQKSSLPLTHRDAPKNRLLT